MCLKVTRNDMFDIVQESSHMTGVCLLLGCMPASYIGLASGKPLDRFLENLYWFSLFWHFISLVIVVWWKHEAEGKT